MNRLGLRTRPHRSTTRDNSRAGWIVLAAAGALALSACAGPPAGFSVFDTAAGDQDELPRWLTLEVGGDEARYLTSRDSARYYISRSKTDHCLVIVFEDKDESFSSGCAGGGPQDGVMVRTSGEGMAGTSGVWGTAALVVDGYPEDAQLSGEGLHRIHENVWVSQLGDT